MKKTKITIIVICALLLIVGILFGTYKLFFAPHRGTVSDLAYTSSLSNTLTKDQAAADIDYMLKLLKQRHPACIDELPEAVASQSRLEKDNLPEQVTVLQIWQASARILAQLNDAHTKVDINMEIDEQIPISFRFSNDKLYCDEGENAGNAIVSIGGISVEDLLRTFKTQFSYEQDGYAEYRFARLCRWKDDLAFLNVDVSIPLVIAFETPDGKISETYTFESYEPEQDAQATPFVTYVIDNENKVGIFTLTECNYNDLYRETLNRFFAEVKDNQIQTVIVDLQNNGGGNSMVANEFIRYLDVDEYFSFGNVDIRCGSILIKIKKSKIINSKIKDLLFQGDVYVLTAPRTFSSATDFATMISDNGIGKIVGETSGGMPSSYGDTLLFQLPNSKLTYTVSYKQFHRPDESKDSLPLIPDYPLPARDALEKVYELVR